MISGAFGSEGNPNDAATIGNKLDAAASATADMQDDGGTQMTLVLGDFNMAVFAELYVASDVLVGGSGSDTLDGGDGDDTLMGGPGADHLIGGTGIDTASYANASIGVTVNLSTGGVTNDAQGDTYSGIENLLGSNYGDILNGDGFANTIDGGAGDDYVFGQGGADRLIGGAGEDTIRGGVGNDVLIGGAGDDRLTGDESDPLTFAADQFVLVPNGGVDTITDFQTGLDKVVLSGFVNPFGNDGVLASGYVGDSGHFYHSNLDTSDQFFYNVAEDILYQVDPVAINGAISGLNAEPFAILGQSVYLSDFVVM